ncbi:[NiFe]-hydrogenase assembly chaperone HybE [Rhodoblastus sp.]|uniref:[NiFe]-hydrogenase assembly chaperone HybE n=1 Tax=Rhodoblastus sp. TaxID=1962975 RepID=UPI0035B21B8A
MDEDARVMECARLAERLEAHFRAVHEGAMRDVPICNERLDVAATGFRPCGDWAVGIVVTPWFMNVIAAPFADAPAVAAAPGTTETLALPTGAVEFLAADLDGFPRLLMCSLFSPMQDFVDQEAAVATAQAALDLLLAQPAPPPPPAPQSMDRRAFFRGAFSREAAS